MGDPSQGRATAAWRRGYHNVVGKKNHTPLAGRLEGYTHWSVGVARVPEVRPRSSAKLRGAGSLRLLWAWSRCRGGLKMHMLTLEMLGPER